ncbi:heme-binding protein [Pseudooceanicola sp.]|uniref:GlcG/HbpS family heme-binding protein n=1 Tax=Pseudooceanicola sp. TaxID=1914328 RepID=UPI00261BF6BE|nr:heme-binding protein [Pseudooceanicola sp.]MDF1855653.1 heme-binding protein [Pseudooceanicola sp.]
MAEISLRRARTIIRKALEAGQAQQMRPLSVVVLDAGGHVKAFERQDGASPGRFGIAHGKAYGAVMLHMSGTALAERVAAGPGGAAFVAAANGVFGGAVVPVPGGVLVRDGKGHVIGAVGVSGDLSERDAAAAVAGIEASGLSAEA